MVNKKIWLSIFIIILMSSRSDQAIKKPCIDKNLLNTARWGAISVGSASFSLWFTAQALYEYEFGYAKYLEYSFAIGSALCSFATGKKAYGYLEEYLKNFHKKTNKHVLPIYENTTKQRVENYNE